MTITTCIILSLVLCVSCYFCFFASFSDEQASLLNQEDRSDELSDSLSTGQKMFAVMSTLGGLIFLMAAAAAILSWIFS